jgi:hypothetical protein
MPIQSCALVLLAGGLGERLGYCGIKLALPAEITTGRCYLQYYIDSLLALQSACDTAPVGSCRFSTVTYLLLAVLYRLAASAAERVRHGAGG